MRKYSALTLVFILLSTLFILPVSAATIGQQLITPEVGWTRYDDTNSAFTYVGNGWASSTDAPAYYYLGEIKYTYEVGDKVRFDFIGDQIRFVMQPYTNRSTSIPVKIDGVDVGTFSDYSTTQRPAVLVFEKTGLTWGRHSVEVTCPNDTQHNMIFDAVDIPSSGSLLSYSNITSVSNVTINLLQGKNDTPSTGLAYKLTIVNYDGAKSIKSSDILPYGYANANY